MKWYTVVFALANSVPLILAIWLAPDWRVFASLFTIDVTLGIYWIRENQND